MGGRREDIEVESFGIQWRGLYSSVGSGGMLQMEHVAVEIVQKKLVQVRCGKKVEKV